MFRERPAVVLSQCGTHNTNESSRSNVCEDRVHLVSAVAVERDRDTTKPGRGACPHPAIRALLHAARLRVACGRVAGIVPVVAIETEEEVACLYGPAADVVQAKVIDRIDAHCRAFIERSPFVLVGSSDLSGRCDVSPKGGEPGFVRVLDERRLAVPDAPGNRLVDTLKNVVANPHVGLLFLIPGMEETLRMNGAALLSEDPALLEMLEGFGKPPKVAIEVTVDEAFLHCAKAFKRSSLWRPDEWPSTEGLARPAQIWRDHMALEDMSVGEVETLVDDDYRDNLNW
jgi:uncharacterized protein